MYAFIYLFVYSISILFEDIINKISNNKQKKIYNFEFILV